MTDENDLRILRSDSELLAATGLKRTARTELLKAGRFPRPVRLSPRCRGWTAKSLQQWLAGRMAEGDSAIELDRAAIAKVRAVERGDRKLRQIKKSNVGGQDEIQTRSKKIGARNSR